VPPSTLIQSSLPKLSIDLIPADITNLLSAVNPYPEQASQGLCFYSVSPKELSLKPLKQGENPQAIIKYMATGNCYVIDLPYHQPIEAFTPPTRLAEFALPKKGFWIDGSVYIRIIISEAYHVHYSSAPADPAVIHECLTHKDGTYGSADHRFYTLVALAKEHTRKGELFSAYTMIKTGLENPKVYEMGKKTPYLYLGENREYVRQLANTFSDFKPDPETFPKVSRLIYRMVEEAIQTNVVSAAISLETSHVRRENLQICLDHKFRLRKLDIENLIELVGDEDAGERVFNHYRLNF
jgi:hypothetical protein